jgi:hypothetical protein
VASRRSIIWNDQLYRPIKMTNGMRKCIPFWHDFDWQIQSLRQPIICVFVLLAFSQVSHCDLGPRLLLVP